MGRTKRAGSRAAAQLTLDRARKPTGHGGWRPGAGRPRGRKVISHDARERFAARYPLHVTLRTVPGVSLRREPVMEIVRAVMTAGGQRDGFRVVEFNVLGNHLHLVAEAAGQEALARGMQGLKVRPTAEPRTWLLATGWRLGGLLPIDEVPGERARGRAGT